MVKTPNPRCFTVNGKLGFYATGHVKLLCSSDTCGPSGKAELWCQECCGRPFGSASTPSVLHDTNSSTHVFQPMVIVSVALGCSLFAVVLIHLIYYLSKKFVLRRGSYHDDQAGLIQGEEISLSLEGPDPGQVVIQDSDLALGQQPYDGGQHHRQQHSMANECTTPEKAEFVMPITSVIRQISNGDQLPLSQQPSNDDEDSGQKSSQAINDTAPGENELVVPGERVVRQLSYGS